jgi:hypothetical protein
MFPAMINDWRQKMNLALPFYFVQLAPYPNGLSLSVCMSCFCPLMLSSSSSFPFLSLAPGGGLYPALRNAQLAATALDNVGYAVAVDLGDPTSPLVCSPSPYFLPSFSLFFSACSPTLFSPFLLCVVLLGLAVLGFDSSS